MIDLQAFCADTNFTRSFDLTQPFFRGGWQYATDGKVMIRIPAPNDLDSAEGTAKLPPCHDLFKPIVGNLIEWPALRYCPQCFDTGKIGCGGCRGCGECEGCTGCGVRKCLLCNGREPSGQVFSDDGVAVIEVGNHRVAARYDQLIRSLGNVRYEWGRAWREPLPFVFDGGEGLVMGCRKDEVQEAA